MKRGLLAALLVIAAPALVVVGAVVLLVVRASGEAPDPINQPGSACWELEHSGLPPEKAASLQIDCDQAKATLERFGGVLPPKGTEPPPPPVPSEIPTPPPCNDQWTPSPAMLACTLYGILEGHQPPAGYEKTYLVENSWSGRRYTVYAGALYDDPDQGVIAVWANTNNTWPTEPLGEYRTPTKEGRVRIVSAQGETLSIVSASGTRDSFGADTMALAKQ